MHTIIVTFSKMYYSIEAKAVSLPIKDSTPINPEGATRLITIVFPCDLKITPTFYRQTSNV